MTHGVHKGGEPREPGDPVLWDGCAECEERGKDPARAISNMDPDRFAEAWTRAVQAQSSGLPDIQLCEVKTLNAIAAVRAQLELHPETLAVVGKAGLAVRDAFDRMQHLVNAMDAAGLLEDHSYTFPDGYALEADVAEGADQ